VAFKYLESLENVVQPSYWVEKFPQFHITDTPFQKSINSFKWDVSNEMQMLKEGYTFLNQAMDVKDINFLYQGIESFIEKGIAPIFSLVFDEYWNLFTSILPIAESVLQESCSLLPASWVWYLSPSDESKGWKPHRERNDPRVIDMEGNPNSISFWIPLSEATPLNGCMYVIPLQYDKNYPDNLAETTVAKLQDIRAVPAKVGDVICFNQALIHWGGRSSEFAKFPRVSIAFEVQRNSLFPPLQVPLIDPRKQFTFFERLKIIIIQATNYSRFNDFGDEFEEFICELYDYANSKLETSVR